MERPTSLHLRGQSHVAAFESELFFDCSIRYMVVSSPGKVRPAHCLTRKDMEFFCGDNQLDDVHSRHADTVEVNFRGHKGDQNQKGT